MCIRDRLGQIHDQQEALHTGRYQELLLTSRQYAFARHGEDSVIIAAVNNDDDPAELVIPVPIQAGEAVNLLEPGDLLPISDGSDLYPNSENHLNHRITVPVHQYLRVHLFQ